PLFPGNVEKENDAMTHRRAKRCGWFSLMLVAIGLVGASSMWLLRTPAGQGPNFDKLSNDDRSIFQKRFEKEILPLLSRQGKDGSMGCYSGKTVSAVRTTGKVDKYFRMLLKEGFFIADDPGSLLSRITDGDTKRRMPPDNRPAWTAEEVSRLRDFVSDL